MFLVTFLSLVTLLLWGASDYLAGRSGKHTDHFVTNFLLQLIGLAVITPIVLFAGLSFSGVGDVLITLVVAALFTLAYVYFIRAMAKGPAGVAAPIANSYAVVTLVIGILFFGVALAGHVIFALLLVVAGALFLSSDRNLFKGKMLHSQTVKLALVTLFSWGVGFALLNPVMERNQWYEVLFVISAGMTAMALFLAAIAMRRRNVRFGQVFSLKNKAAMLCGLLLAMGSIAFFAAAGKGGDVTIPAVIASASPLVTSYMARLFDKEKLSLFNRAGAIMVVAGIIVLNL